MAYFSKCYKSINLDLEFGNLHLKCYKIKYNNKDKRLRNTGFSTTTDIRDDGHYATGCWSSNTHSPSAEWEDFSAACEYFQCFHIWTIVGWKFSAFLFFLTWLQSKISQLNIQHNANESIRKYNRERMTEFQLEYENESNIGIWKWRLI